MNFIDKVLWVYALDKRLWKEKIEPNKYFSSFCIYFSMLIGSIMAILNVIDSYDYPLWDGEEWGIFLLKIWTLMLGESILLSNKFYVAICRSLILLIFIFIAFGLGVVLTYVMIIFIVLIVISMLLAGGSSRNTKKIELDNGAELTESGDDLLGTGKNYTGSDGKNYKSFDGGQTFHEQ